MAAREVAVAALARSTPSSVPRRSRPIGAALATQWSLATALALLAWYIFAPQCVSTLVVIRRETGRARWMWVTIGYMFALAYVAAFATYQIATLLGGERPGHAGAPQYGCPDLAARRASVRAFRRPRLFRRFQRSGCRPIGLRTVRSLPRPAVSPDEALPDPRPVSSRSRLGVLTGAKDRGSNAPPCRRSDHPASGALRKMWKNPFSSSPMRLMDATGKGRGRSGVRTGRSAVSTACSASGASRPVSVR